MEEDKTKIKLSKESEVFLKLYLKEYTDGQKFLTKERSSELNSAAFIYEKIRVAMEYQEEHLIFKNAISRILRRRYIIMPSIKAEMLTGDLMRELAWANYVNPEKLKKETWSNVEAIIDRYLAILNNLRYGLYTKLDLQKKIIDWMACEIEDYIKPKNENDLFINFTALILSKNLIANSSKINETDNSLLIKVTVFNLIYKPDLPLLEYYILNKVYPKFKKYDLVEAKKFGLSFEPYYNQINKYINHPLRANYLRYIKRFIPPFIVLRSTLNSGNFISETVLENPSAIESEADEMYRFLINGARTKVFRGTLRALTFIFLTKIMLAFILEVPFDKHFAGGINYLSLTINILTPPVLMFIAGTFIKSPPKKNARLVSETINKILVQNSIGDQKFALIPKRNNKSYALFNSFYSLFNLGVLATVIWLLVKLDFNIVSIFLFFFFVSIVSFFSFRIRNIALELAMKRSSDDAITTTMEFVFLPFIKIGKFISSKFAAFNPTMMIVDFLIEAPLKTIIRIVNYWRSFIASKKEEMEY